MYIRIDFIEGALTESEIREYAKNLIFFIGDIAVVSIHDESKPSVSWPVHKPVESEDK